MTTSVRASAPSSATLDPLGGSVHVVRWVRQDEHGARQRFYRQRAAAVRFLDRLTERGYSCAMYSTPVDWTRVQP